MIRTVDCNLEKGVRKVADPESVTAIALPRVITELFRGPEGRTMTAYWQAVDGEKLRFSVEVKRMPFMYGTEDAEPYEVDNRSGVRGVSKMVKATLNEVKRHIELQLQPVTVTITGRNAVFIRDLAINSSIAAATAKAVLEFHDIVPKQGDLKRILGHINRDAQASGIGGRQEFNRRGILAPAEQDKTVYYSIMNTHRWEGVLIDALQVWNGKLIELGIMRNGHTIVAGYETPKERRDAIEGVGEMRSTGLISLDGPIYTAISARAWQHLPHA